MGLGCKGDRKTGFHLALSRQDLQGRNSLKHKKIMFISKRAVVNLKPQLPEIATELSII